MWLELWKVKHPKARHFERLPLIFHLILPVRLCFLNERDHTICVGATREHILDSVERCSLSLSTEALFTSAGGNRSHSRIGEDGKPVNGTFPKRKSRWLIYSSYCHHHWHWMRSELNWLNLLFVFPSLDAAPVLVDEIVWYVLVCLFNIFRWSKGTPSNNVLSSALVFQNL